MAGQQGRDVLVKIGDSGSPTTFTTIGGGRVHEMSIDDESIDVSDKDTSGRWAERIRGGPRAAELSLEGVFKDTAAEETMRALVESDSIVELEFVFPGQGSWTGFWSMTNITFRGEYDGAAEYSATFENAGPIAFA